MHRNSCFLFCFWVVFRVGGVPCVWSTWLKQRLQGLWSQLLFTIYSQGNSLLFQDDPALCCIHRSKSSALFCCLIDLVSGEAPVNYDANFCPKCPPLSLNLLNNSGECCGHLVSVIWVSKSFGLKMNNNIYIWRREKITFRPNWYIGQALVLIQINFACFWNK